MHRSPCVCIIQCTTDIIAAHRVCVPQVVAVILENFTSLGNLNPDLVSAHDIQEFKEAWAAYDPDGNGRLPAKVLPELIMSLKPPLGIKDTPVGRSTTSGWRFCLSLGLKSEGGEVGGAAHPRTRTPCRMHMHIVGCM